MMTNDLRTAALAAYEEQQREVAEDRLRQREDYRQFAHAVFVRTFGFNPESVTTDAADNVIVSASGLAFLYDGEGGFSLWDRCPHCGALVVGQSVFSLEMLGEIIAESIPFAPYGYRHNCQPEPVPEPDPDPMLAALQSIAAELRRANDAREAADDFAATVDLYRQ